MTKRKRQGIIITAVSIPLAFLLIVMPLSTVIIYESIFGARYKTPQWLEFSAEDFEGLTAKKSNFVSDGDVLAGYEYSKSQDTVKGVVVIAHGIGDSGHNMFMPFIDYFTDNGYYVFAYDSHGRGESGIGSIGGFPQGVIDLDSALTYVKSLDVYEGLPIMLFGHSWGGYSVGNVLEFHPDVRAAVIISGFNESEDMFSFRGEMVGGGTMDFAMLYLDAYEKLKFGEKYTDITAVDALADSEAGVMVVHGGQDYTVPAEYGYEKFHSVFADNGRFEFVYYADRGHEYIFCSEESEEYRKQIECEYERYIEESGKRDTAKNKNEFMTANFDKMKGYEPDAQLMARVLEMYDEYCLE